MLLNLTLKRTKLLTDANNSCRLALSKLSNYYSCSKANLNRCIVNSSASKQSLLAESASSSIKPNRQYTSVRVRRVNFLSSNSRFIFLLGNSIAKSTIGNKVYIRNMSTTSTNLKLLKVYENVAKSPQDQRMYRGLLLDNQLKCLLISDPLTDRSAASVDVHAGYMLDPKEFPGLAHFCEHMLFMGSKKVDILTINRIAFNHL
jgi:hypothetical protein